MLYLIVGLGLFITFIFLVKGLSSPDPATVKKFYKITMIVLGIILIPIMLRFGKPLIAGLITLVLAIIPYTGRLLQLAYNYKIFSSMLKKKNAPTPNSAEAKMSKAKAYEILEVSPNATTEEIEASYKRLIKQIHPDTGGSKYFTTELNQAKDLLLKGK